jgi:hypothetical protein
MARAVDDPRAATAAFEAVGDDCSDILLLNVLGARKGFLPNWCILSPWKLRCCRSSGLDCIFRLRAAISLRSARPSRLRCDCRRVELKANEHCNIAASIMSINILCVYVLLKVLRTLLGGDAEAASAGSGAEAAHLVPLSPLQSSAKSISAPAFLKAMRGYACGQRASYSPLGSMHA